MLKFFGVPCLVFWCLHGVGYAQDAETRLVEEIRSAYEQLNYAQAEIKAKAALTTYQRFTPSQLTEVHRILAIIYFTQNKTVDAREQFDNALALDPDLTLDPLFISPKIIDFFEQIKQERQRPAANKSEIGETARYVLIPDRRAGAAVRSMLLPGWGQRYKGETKKGTVLLGLWGVTAVGAIAAHVVREDAEKKYLAATRPADIESRYNTFNTYHKLRNNLALGAAGVWLFSYIDALVRVQSNDVRHSHAVNDRKLFSTLGWDSLRLCYSVHF